MKLIPLFLIIFILSITSGSSDLTNEQDPIDTTAKVTFIELGYVNCVPCRNMVPVMESLAERYGKEQLDVRFIDVVKDKEAAKPYKIKMMPTQVFLDENGIEFHRHEGFYPEEEIDVILQARGLKPIK